MNNPYIILATGVSVGLLSGLLGIGGGIILLPVMASIWKVQRHIATATSLAVVLPTALVGSFLYQQQGNMDLMLALKITVGSIIGAWIGSNLACRLPAARLKRIFGVLLLLAGLWMVISS